MSRHFFRFLWVATLLAFAGLACNLISGVQDRATSLQQTANAASTGIQEGKDFVATVAGAATQVGQSGVVQTLQAEATKLQESGALETAQAFATRNIPGLVATAQAFATEQGPGLVETLQAFATQQGPGLVETLQAVATQQGPEAQQTLMALATQAAGSPAAGGPADVPIVPGETRNLLRTPTTITYSTPMSLPDVQAFYERELPAQGWQKSDQANTSTSNLSVLYYDKPDRHLIVTLTHDPASGQTLVVINLQNK